MTRTEFSRKQRAEMWLRAKGNCEECGARLKVGSGEYDHILPLSMGGETEVSNGQLVCGVCHKAKTAREAPRRAKADRVRDKATGAWKPSSRGFSTNRNGKWKQRMDGTVVRR